jgi:hypothetical protein
MAMATCASAAWQIQVLVKAFARAAERSLNPRAVLASASVPMKQTCGTGKQLCQPYN